MAIIVYKDFTEALEDIRWDGKGRRADFKVVHRANQRDIRERRVKEFFGQEFELWIKGESRLEYTQGEEYAKSAGSILWELIKNAEYATRIRETFTAELYVGKRGSLMGTRQKARFLEDAEIELLTVWQEPVYSAKVRSCDFPLGRGTTIFLEEGNGILVLPNQKEKAIYVSKLFKSPARESSL